MRRGIALIEVLVAGAVLLVLTLPLVDMVAENGRAVASLTRRLVLELRARRHQTEAAATTYATLLAAGALPMGLAEPADAEAYNEHVQGVDEACEVHELASGLAEVRARVAWTPARGGPREVLCRRLVADPTHAMRLSFPLSVVAR